MNVLVVQDNEDVAASLAFLLDCYGHRATVAQDGETALSLLRGYAFGLVLLDENLPGIKGSAVARSIITTPLAGRTFIVPMTGDSEVGGLTRLFDVWLRKPFSLRCTFASQRRCPNVGAGQRSSVRLGTLRCCQVRPRKPDMTLANVVLV